VGSTVQSKGSQARLIQSIDLINAGRIDLAERLVRAVLEEDPREAEAHRLLSHCLRGRKKYAAAIDEAAEAVRLAPRRAPCHHSYGQALHAIRRYSDAEAALREAIKLLPSFPAYHASLSALLRDVLDFEGSVVEARAGLALDPANTECLSQLGLTLIRLHRIEEAHQIFRNALSDTPTLTHLHNNLGITLLRQGETQAAAGEFREALRLDPTNPAAATNLRNLSYHREGWRPDPYRLRLRFRWGRLPLAVRAAIISALAVAGFVWPGFWGADAWPVALEARRAFGARKPEWGANIFYSTRLVIILALALLLAGPAPTTTSTWLSLPTFEGLELANSAPVLVQTDVYAPTYMLAVVQLFAGALLISVAIPAVVSRGWARLAAIAMLAVGALTALWTAMPGTITDAVWPAAIIVLFAGSLLAGRLTYWIENKEYRGVFETEAS
jgi:Tfp pilus assembly protein PilF